MRLFQAALDTCLDSPFFASLSVHGLHFTVYTPSKGSGDLLSFGSLPRSSIFLEQQTEKTKFAGGGPKFAVTSLYQTASEESHEFLV